jgi:type VI secretion system protein VasD
VKADLLATKDVVLRPDTSASLTEPMKPDTQIVGVVAFFREPSQNRTWKLAIDKKQWKKTDPVKIELNGNDLVLVGAEPPPVTRDAPQQAAPANAASSSVARKQG